MITHIRMKNFKSWKDSVEVKLAPLTGFFGTNSSGKSSLLQMLLLLKQSMEHEDSREIFFFGDENSYVNLGDFREVIHDNNVEEPLELGFGCQIQNPFIIETDPPNGIGHRKKFKLDVNSFTFEVTVLWQKNILSVVKENYRVKYEDKELLIDGNVSKRIHNEPYWSRSTVPPISQFISKVKKLFNHVEYLGPVRVQPQRQYHWEGTHPKKIDQSGDGAIDAVLSAGVRKLKSSNKEDAVLIEDRISEWLQKMELAHSFRVIPTKSLDDQNYEVRIRKSPSSAEVTLADMGYGLADVLPMLIYFYYVEEGSTLILEQPGVHLHPKVQADLADLLIKVINERNLQILVESHSEHLLTRLQLRIAEQKIGADQTALYFCKNENGTSNIKPLELDDLGNIKNWPKDFFGNVRGDLLKMTREQVKRQKKTEG